MVPIQDLLHRITWDPACRGSAFDIGYIDRVAGTIVRVHLADVRLESGTPPALSVRDDGGAVLRIPLHRVRQVWKDGVIVWARRLDDALQSSHGGDTHS